MAKKFDRGKMTREIARERVGIVPGGGAIRSKKDKAQHRRRLKRLNPDD